MIFSACRQPIVSVARAAYERIRVVDVLGNRTHRENDEFGLSWRVRAGHRRAQYTNGSAAASFSEGQAPSVSQPGRLACTARAAAATERLAMGSEFFAGEAGAALLSLSLLLASEKDASMTAKVDRERYSWQDLFLLEAFSSRIKSSRLRQGTAHLLRLRLSFVAPQLAARARTPPSPRQYELQVAQGCLEHTHAVVDCALEDLQRVL